MRPHAPSNFYDILTNTFINIYIFINIFINMLTYAVDPYGLPHQLNYNSTHSTYGNKNNKQRNQRGKVCAPTTSNTFYWGALACLLTAATALLLRPTPHGTNWSLQHTIIIITYGTAIALKHFVHRTPTTRRQARGVAARNAHMRRQNHRYQQRIYQATSSNSTTNTETATTTPTTSHPHARKDTTRLLGGSHDDAHSTGADQHGYTPTDRLGCTTGWTLPGARTLLTTSPTTEHVYFERQHKALCAIHAANMFLQQPHLTQQDLLDTAQSMSQAAGPTRRGKQRLPLEELHNQQGQFAPAVLVEWLHKKHGIRLHLHQTPTPEALAHKLADTDRAILITHRHALTTIKHNGAMLLMDSEMDGPIELANTRDIMQLHTQGVRQIYTETPNEATAPLLRTTRATAPTPTPTTDHRACKNTDTTATDSRRSTTEARAELATTSHRACKNTDTTAADSRRMTTEARAEIATTLTTRRLAEIAHVVEVLARWNALQPAPEADDPAAINNWNGSCFDLQERSQGQALFVHLNARTLGVTGNPESRDAQETMWKAFARLGADCVMLSDTALIDPTPDDPISSLAKTQTIAKFAWGQKHLQFTHGQGNPGVLRPAVGGTLIATGDTLSKLQGPRIDDSRGWGRFTGRLLIGRDNTSLAIITAYFPCTASKTVPGSAWQTQLALMQALPEVEQQKDPWHLCLADLAQCIWQLLNEGASDTKLERRTVILAGDFNARWTNDKPEHSASQQRTRALRAFAAALGLAEPMATLHPTITPRTFFKSDAPGAHSSWIDLFLVSESMLAQGHITEAGILQHEVLNNSDHRAYAIQVQLHDLLRLGDHWKTEHTSTDPKLVKLPLRNAKTTSEFQCRVLERWESSHAATHLANAACAVHEWSTRRDHELDSQGNTSWGEVDNKILPLLDVAMDALINCIVGGWRRAKNCLQAYQLTGGKRKDGWSPICIQKMRNLRCLQDITAMWKRHACSREHILARATDLKQLPGILRAAPGVDAQHTQWRQWIQHIASRIPILKGELHGVKRKLLQQQMQEAAEKRNMRWDSNERKNCIATWLRRSRPTGPMRSVLTTGQDGSPELVVDEIPLRQCLDRRFDAWMSEKLFQSTPMDLFWYQADGGHDLAASTAAGRAMRIRAAQGELQPRDMDTIPERYHMVLEGAKTKYLKSAQRHVAPSDYTSKGCMQHVSQSVFRSFWAKAKKGTAPGSTQMSTNMVWSLQLMVDHGTNKSANKHVTHLTNKRACLTTHVFDAIRQLINMVLDTGMVPTRLLAETLYPLDKVEGLTNIENKRPIGLVECIIQCLFGTQYAIVEDVWAALAVISPIQCGYTRKATCEFPIMDVTAKAEYSYMYKTFLAVLWMDQSKAFDTLHLHLGIEMPLRRVAIPEKLIKLTVNAKFGSWCMVASIYGPTEADWTKLTSQPTGGINKLLPAPGETAFGYDPKRGTTQGSKHSTSVYKCYYDWKVDLQLEHGTHLAPYTSQLGLVRRTIGNALADDTNYTNDNIEGSKAALTTAALFFAFMGGCLNIDKTCCSVLDWIQDTGTGEHTGKYKTLCLPGEEWDPTRHLPKELLVADPRTLDMIETTQALLAAVRGTGDAYRDLTSSLVDRLQMLESRRIKAVKIRAPDDAVLYLGVWLPLSLRYMKAHTEAKIEITTTAECLRGAAITPAQLKEVVRITASQVGSWRLRMTSLLPEQLHGIETRLLEVVKHKYGLCSKHPTEAFMAALHDSVADQILLDRITMLIRMLRAKHSIADTMQGSLWMLQRWIGSETPALEYKHHETIGWNGTWLGALAIWISKHNLSIVGGQGIPLQREYDGCLVDLVPAEHKRLMAEGCWQHSVWRLSDIHTMQNERVSDLFSTHWTTTPPGWRDLVVDIMNERLREDAPALGAWLPANALDRVYMGRLDISGALELVRCMGPADAAGQVLIRPLTRLLRTNPGAKLTPAKQTIEDWLEQLGGCACTHDTEEHTHECYIWADTDPANEANQTMASREEAAELLPVAFTVRKGVLHSNDHPDTGCNLVAIDEPSYHTAGTYDKLPRAQQTHVLDGVNAELIMGTYFRTDRISAAVRDTRATNWRHTLSHLDDTSILYAYSDCSKRATSEGPKLAYGWLIGGVADPGLTAQLDTATWPSRISTEVDLYQLTQGAWGGGVVHGHHRSKSTYRGEAFGVLAVLLFIVTETQHQRIPRGTRVWMFCDNESVCAQYNAELDIHGESDLTGADPDLWALLYALRKEVGQRFKLTWQRSHPERRKLKTAYHRHNWGNTWSDQLADDALEAIHESTEPTALGHTLDWGVRWGDELITSDIRKAIRMALKAEHFVHYLRDTREWASPTLQDFPRERWISKLACINNVATATVINKLMVGWLATMTVQARRSAGQCTSATCRLCGLAPESNWHVLAECTHATMTHTRTTLMTKILETITSLPLPTKVKQLVSINWLVSSTGTLVDISSDEALASTLRDWAPDLAAVLDATDARHALLWDQPQGKNGDDLRKWAFKGILPAQWTELLSQFGATKAEVDASLTKIELVVCETVPELWREFCAHVHDAEGKQAGRSALATRIQGLLATWDGLVPRGLARDVFMWTPSKQRQWANKVQRARKQRDLDRALDAKTPARQPDARITDYYEHLPTASDTRPKTDLERRGRLFAREASRRQRHALPQATLRDCGWEIAQGPTEDKNPPQATPTPQRQANNRVDCGTRPRDSRRDSTDSGQGWGGQPGDHQHHSRNEGRYKPYRTRQAADTDHGANPDD